MEIELTHATETRTRGDLGRYASVLASGVHKNEFESQCRTDGYQIGVDFNTMKPVYWFPSMPKTSENFPPGFIKENWDFLKYANIGEFDKLFM